MFFELFFILFVTTLLFITGMLGIVLNRRSILVVLISVELVLLSVNLNFIFFSVFLDSVVGQVFALFILTVAAAESAVGLAILVAYFQVHGSVNARTASLLQGLAF